MGYDGRQEWNSEESRSRERGAVFLPASGGKRLGGGGTKRRLGRPKGRLPYCVRETSNERKSTPPPYQPSPVLAVFTRVSPIDVPSPGPHDSTHSTQQPKQTSLFANCRETEFLPANIDHESYDVSATSNLHVANGSKLCHARRGIACARLAPVPWS
jgi:hypothetical protein